MAFGAGDAWFALDEGGFLVRTDLLVYIQAELRRQYARKSGWQSAQIRSSGFEVAAAFSQVRLR
jgi:hypothetical protein